MTRGLSPVESAHTRDSRADSHHKERDPKRHKSLSPHPPQRPTGCQEAQAVLAEAEAASGAGGVAGAVAVGTVPACTLDLHKVVFAGLWCIETAEKF